MIKNIVFDFGGVFIDLNKQVLFNAMERYGVVSIPTNLEALNSAYEIGAISSRQFLDSLHQTFPMVSLEDLKTIWNSMLLDLPNSRLQFAEQLRDEGTYRMFLLSNTNAIHIEYVNTSLGPGRFDRFKRCFEKVYLSYEIGLRKPNKEIFEFVLGQNGLSAEETLFIDDTQEHIEGASSVGLKTWHLQVGKEDVSQLGAKL